jgi:glucoamylase
MSDFIVYLNAFPAIQADFNAVSELMLGLMMRNVTTAGWVIQDPSSRVSIPGCIIASPSYPADNPDTDQNYIYNWTRDSAITAVELNAAKFASNLEDYVSFANIAQIAAQSDNKPIGWACYYIDGTPRDWTEQGDGPALQTLAILQAWSQLGSAARATASSVVNKNLTYLLGAYQKPLFNLWEETSGYSFFTRSVQLECFTELLAQTSVVGITSQQQTQIQAACADLKTQLATHWNATNGLYESILPINSGRGADLNVDVVMASVYGAISCLDSKLLATAAQIRSTFADSGSPYFYQINAQDATLGMGPMMGRYPGDTYDGDLSAGETPGGHPWAPCTCNFAELYYMVAAAINQSNKLTIDNLSAPFFAQIGINQGTSVANAVNSLRNAGDQMLRAIVRHSAHLELSEQFDGNDGYEMSVQNLTWSYASFMSAVRARNQI